MKHGFFGVLFVVACTGMFGCAIDPIDWKPVGGWETLDSKHRAETIQQCKEKEDFMKCMYANSYVRTKDGSVLSLSHLESEQEEISVTEFKP